MPHLADFQRMRIVELNAQKMPHNEIARTVGCCRSTTFDIIKKWRATNSLKDRPKCGRSHKLSERDQRSIRRLVTTGKCESAADAHRHLQELGIKSVSVSTVKNVLHAGGMRSYLMQRKPALNAVQMKKRLDWAKARIDLQLNNWRRMLFSDEAMFYIQGGSAHRWAWRHDTDPVSRRRIIPTKKFGGGSIMVWAAISYHGFAAAVPIQGT